MPNKHKESTRRKALIINSLHLDVWKLFQAPDVTKWDLKEWLIPLPLLLTASFFQVVAVVLVGQIDMLACSLSAPEENESESFLLVF